MNKVCTKCGLEKPIDEFVINNSKKDGHGSQCKLCHRKVCNAYYLTHKHTIRKNAKNYQNRMRQFVDSFKSGGCVLCGEKDIACLDLHHLRDKEFTIAHELTNVSKDKIKAEIGKCVTLCSNCHRKLHYYKWDLNEKLAA